MFTPFFSEDSPDNLVFDSENGLGQPIPLKPDKPEKPLHYQQGVSPYDVARSMFGARGLLTFVLVNSIKYIQRYPHKYDGSPDKQLDDLLKARESLSTAIELHKELYGDGKVRHG